MDERAIASSVAELVMALAQGCAEDYVTSIDLWRNLARGSE